MKHKIVRLATKIFLVFLLCCLIIGGAVVASQLHGISFQGQIAVQGDISPQDSGIFLYNRIFHTVKRLTPQNMLAFSPTWSPNGEKIALVYSDIDRVEFHIGVIDTNSGKTESVIDKGVDNFLLNQDTSLAWSEDGDQLLFDVASNDCHVLYLYRFDIKTSRRLNIDFCKSKSGDRVYRLNLSWFPNNIPLAGVSYQSFYHYTDDIYVLDQTLAKASWVTKGSYPVWRPGTSLFSYICQNTWTPFPNSICLYSMKQASPTIILKDYSYDKYAWSPDGSAILFIDKGYEEGNPAILTLVNIETGDKSRLNYLWEFDQAGGFLFNIKPWLEGEVVWSSR